MRTTVTAVLFSWLFALVATAQQAPPKEWIDPDTGHRIVRLTEEPGIASLYFNQNSYTPDGKSMIFTTPSGISVLDLATRQAKQVVSGRVRVIMTGHKTRSVFYIQDNAVYSANLDTLVTRRIAGLPTKGSISTVNADETLLAGTYEESPGARPGTAANGDQQIHPLDQPVNKGQMMEQRLAARIPLALFTVDTRTGETKVLHRATDWLNHLEFSPTDPTLLMLCHEGPWHKIDRIWTIRTDGTQLTKIHSRTMEMEIWGHEFWSHDGGTIWFDLQTPRGEDFWLAGVNVKTKERTQYHLQRNEWSIHFSVTADGSLFCGDGGDPGQVARATDGQWIYLFRPEARKDEGLTDASFVKTGVLRGEKLVNMAKHNYRLEPNVTFTPDQKWVVFRSNMFGPTYTFAVEVAKATGN